ncbi:MAG: hypothetical protein M1829_003085 [Trizodia sp. TS-e1964]|nr:MAG: hypothetical protein M1829_003085 [Trizodia sp. TS-e1964]
MHWKVYSEDNAGSKKKEIGALELPENFLHRESPQAKTNEAAIVVDPPSQNNAPKTPPLYKDVKFKPNTVTEPTAIELDFAAGEIPLSIAYKNLPVSSKTKEVRVLFIAVKDFGELKDLDQGFHSFRLILRFYKSDGEGWLTPQDKAEYYENASLKWVDDEFSKLQKPEEKGEEAKEEEDFRTR